MSNTKVSSEQIIDDVALGGNPTTTTQSAGNNTTRVATTAFVTTAVSNLVDSAPSSLDTLNELAAAMNDNASFFSTVLPLSGGTMTGALTIGANFTVDTDTLFVDASNNRVKMGDTATASATNAPLHVAKSSTDVQAIFGDNNSSIDDPSIRIIGRDSGNSAIRYMFAGLDADANYGFVGYNHGSGSFINALNFDTSGNVGIGTQSPSSPLEIKSSATNNTGGLRIIQDSGTNLVASLFGGVNSGTRFGRLELSETSGDAINVRVSADPSLTSYINAGNFGIGDTNPSAIRLSVVTPTANHVGLQVENSNTADSFGMIVKGGNDANDYTADFRKRDNTGIMRIRGDGNIGIGTTSPSEKLEVAGNIKVGSGGIVNSDTFNNRANSANIIYRSSSTTIVGNNANALVVADAGNIGIGTSSPQGNLHVEGAAGASGGGIIYVTDADNGSTASDALHISKSGDTAFVYNRESSGDLQLGAGNTAGHVVIKSSGNVGIGTTAPSQKLHVDGIIASQNSAQGTGLLQLQGYGNTAYINHTGSSNLHFRMGSGFTTRMTLTNAGNLGVGTSSPASLLTVEGDIRQTTGDLLYGGGGNWDIKHLADDQNIVFYTSESGSATEKMRIKANGAIGIGTSSPSASHKLTVGGDTKFTGQLSMSDNQLIKMGDSEDFAFYHDTSIGNVIKSSTSDMDISILGNDGGSTITALSFDMSAAGAATFNSSVTATTYATSSDARLKDVTGTARGLEVINKLNPVAYNWKADGKADEGLIAQEVKELVPNAVVGSEADMYSMDYSKLVVHLVAGMQEQQKQMQEQQAIIEDLQTQLNKLKR